MTACCRSLLLTSVALASTASASNTYPITSTGQTQCYTYPSGGPAAEVNCDGSGQDAAYERLQQSFCSPGDDTVIDLNTGLQWTKGTYYTTYEEAQEPFTYAGHADWRLPTIKELYTLINFNGETGMSEEENVPYIDSEYFRVTYGTTVGGRFIDGQEWSTTTYTGTIMNNDNTSCQAGANLIDGRIKCYEGTKFARYVRGNTLVGVNDFRVDGDSIIVDDATGLEWMKYDSGWYGAGDKGAMDWDEALEYCEGLTLDGFTDWRLPDAKELHSIVDYTRSPEYTDSAAIHPWFYATPTESEISENDYGWYWTSTNHHDGPEKGKNAVYIAFGTATGYHSVGGRPSEPMDVHGAGAQRSEQKVGPVPTPNYRGPQGDYLRIHNLVRCVRGGSSASPHVPSTCSLEAGDDTTPPDDIPDDTNDVTPSEDGAWNGHSLYVCGVFSFVWLILFAL